MGIVEVRGAGILSGLNNISLYSVAKKKFSSRFGFSRQEIHGLVKSPSELQNVYEWYNGYNIGGDMMINPWSFMKWIIDKEFDSYWVQTSYLEAISSIISPHVDKMMGPIFEILFDKKQRFEISPLDTKVNYSVTVWDSMSILHFLVHTGYLTYTVENGKPFVSIPNKELRLCWEKDVIPLLKNKLQLTFSSELKESLGNFDTENIVNLMNDVLLRASYLDFSNSYENSYHMLYLGYFSALFYGESNVIISSNREAGLGRYDIRIEFRNLKKVIVFELKKSSSEKNLDSDVDNALDQILRQKYTSDLSGYQCLLVGAAFYKKQPPRLKFQEVQN